MVFSLHAYTAIESLTFGSPPPLLLLCLFHPLTLLLAPHTPLDTLPSMLTSSIITALALTTVANAAVLPRQLNETSSNETEVSYYSGRGSDPDFTISPIQLDSVLSCAGGLQNITNPILLVPGSKLTSISSGEDTNVYEQHGRMQPWRTIQE